ncbi:SDR family oxidoreductase [Shimia biformata]|uniref:SDR family oxidoreductase n=1 Tax=Shimia biformata TaxID=1294299 RepID=UPI00195250B4|nr:SDR family NAD(P)-dependent oxidoreductase [Shimia biformata]
MERALVIGATGGIGSAITAALQKRGLRVTGLSRRDGLDFNDANSINSVLTGLEPDFDLILVTTGILTAGRDRPEKSLREISAEELAAQFMVNTIGPALILKHAPRLLPRNRRSVFAALSARVGSIGDNRAGGWYSYRASKAALNQIIHTGAIELSRTHRQSVCVALHPGTVATRFTAAYPGHDKLSAQDSAHHLLAVLDQLTPAQTGRFFDWKGEAVPW